MIVIRAFIYTIIVYFLIRAFWSLGRAVAVGSNRHSGTTSRTAKPVQRSKQSVQDQRDIEDAVWVDL